MKLFTALFGAFAIAAAATTSPTVECVDFSVSAGTGCAWMCNYCAVALGTNNYYFTTDICTYQQGVGCVGNPQTGVTYRCCAAVAEEDEEEELVAEDDETAAYAACEEEEEEEDIEFETEDIYLVTIRVKATKLA